MSCKQRGAQYADQRQSLVDCFLPNIAALCEGGTVPTDGTAGFSPGTLWLKRDAAALGGVSLYINEGTKSSCDFNALTTGASDLANRLVASGASLTVTAAAHDRKIIVLAAAAAITLPAFSGSGAIYRFICGATATAVTITATGAYLYGKLWMNTDSAFQAGTLFTVGGAVSTAGSTVITLDGSTKGGNIGDWIEIVDVATNIGAVRGDLNASGTEATPFS